MDKNLIARASVTINAPSERVWDALVNPEAIKQYMFGTNVASDWREGSAIIWRGEWQGRPYQDEGVILRFKPGRALQYSHFSPPSGFLIGPKAITPLPLSCQAREIKSASR